MFGAVPDGLPWDYFPLAHDPGVSGIDSHKPRLLLFAPAEATVVRVTKYLTLNPRVRSMLLPHCKRLLHARIGKEFHANLALDRPSHHTLQVGPPGYLFRRDTNL